MPSVAQPAVSTTAPAVQEVTPAACTTATTDGAPYSDGGHVTPEAAAAPGSAAFKANKKCPCPNCRPPAPAMAPAAAGAAKGSAQGTAVKGTGSYGAHVKHGGESDMVWQLGKSAAQQGRKQQQMQPYGGRAIAGQQSGKAAAAQPGGMGQGKGGKGGKGSSRQFDAKTLPAKPLLAAPTGKQMTEAKPQPKKPKESFKVKLQKFTAKLVKRKKE